MNCDELAQLSKEQLIDLMLQQWTAFQKLQLDYEALKLKFEQNQKQPPTTSKNSSQPPSRDQKSNTSKDKSRHRHGPPQGHAKHERKFVADPDQVVHLRAKHCLRCQADLRRMNGRLVKVNQITELPEAKAQVIEVRQYETDCPQCGLVQVEEPLAGLEMERTFGARLEATVVYYRQEQHMSYERTQLALQNLHGAQISQGGIDDIMQRGGKQALQKVEPIQVIIGGNGCFVPPRPSCM
jgi:hypothetical protein